MIDDKLSWKQQIKEKCTKISKGSWAMNRIKNYVDYNTLRSVYFAIIYPHLQYCTNSWENASHLALQPLMTSKKRCIRILTGRGYRDHTNPLFWQSKCLKINGIYRLEMAKIMYRIHNKMIVSMGRRLCVLIFFFDYLNK